ncbi:hypothetical protein CR513_62908, partial [Mucuna pruriens]
MNYEWWISKMTSDEVGEEDDEQKEKLTLVEGYIGNEDKIFIMRIGLEVLVFELGHRLNGTTLSIEISYWLIVILTYTKYSPACQKTKIALGSNALRSSKLRVLLLSLPINTYGLLFLHLYVVVSLTFNMFVS